jgi:hypothetical protein
MPQNRLIAVLMILLLIVPLVYYANRNEVGGLPGVLASNTKFTPLSVQEPQLRLDELARLQKLEYTGSHRNIFTAAPLPPPPAPVEPKHPFPTVPSPPPIPPVQVPGEFFGFALMKNSGKRVAFFKVGEDVLVVPEGDTFLNRFRLVRIGNDSADVEQLSDGRHATVAMVQPAAIGDPVAPPSGPGLNPQPDSSELTPRQ